MRMRGSTSREWVRQEWVRNAALVVIACVAASSWVGLAACSERYKSESGPSAEEMTAWARSLDTAGADLGRRAAVYATVVASVDKAAAKNARALTKWDKEWKKRQTAYDTQVAAVNAHNAAEREKAAENPSRTLPRIVPAYKLVYDPSTGRFVKIALPKPPPIVLAGYQPQYQSPPAKPRPPAVIRVKFAPQIKKLEKLMTKLKAFERDLATLDVGDGFAPVLAEMRVTAADLRERARDARKALKTAVKKDAKRGDVIVAKRLAGLKAGDLATGIAALADSLREAADAAGVPGALAWASASAGASPAARTSTSPAP